jgi:hypothetical protein
MSFASLLFGVFGALLVASSILVMIAPRQRFESGFAAGLWVGITLLVATYYLRKSLHEARQKLRSGSSSAVSPREN